MQGQTEWIKNPNQNQTGNTPVCSGFGMGVNQHKGALQTEIQVSATSLIT